MKNNKTLQYALIGLGLLILPLILQTFGNAWVRIADMALLYILLAIGLNIVVGYAGLLDLGYVAFFAVGAYMYGLLSSPHLEAAADTLQGKYLDRLRSLNRDIEGLHTRLVALEADKLVEIEKILTKEQLTQLHEIRQDAPVSVKVASIKSAGRKTN